jgi:hypothetical protein
LWWFLCQSFFTGDVAEILTFASPTHGAVPLSIEFVVGSTSCLANTEKRFVVVEWLRAGSLHDGFCI